MKRFPTHRAWEWLVTAEIILIVVPAQLGAGGQRSTQLCSMQPRPMVLEISIKKERQR
jgi:hypothetical protein